MDRLDKDNFNSTTMKNLFELFFNKVKSNEINVYNEFSLQHELGIFLRDKIIDYNIEFERNVSHFGFDKSNFIKKEIDISIYANADLKTTVELKYPRNGQVPEQMFSFIKDLKFLEELTSNGFSSGYLIILTEDPLFYSGKDTGIYSYFRSQKIINGEIQKPTGKKDELIKISKNYSAKWDNLENNLKYCVIEVSQ